MKDSLLLILFLLIGSYICIKSIADINKEHYDKQINFLKDKIKSLQSSKLSNNQNELASAWGQLGIILQARDIRFHSGGMDSTEILNAFNNALKLSNSNNYHLNIEVNHHKGVLLKMMGRGQEAIECYDLALSIVRSNEDKSLLLTSKGDALVMIGDLQSALALYKESLLLNPLRLSIYYQIVKIYSEIGNTTKDDWKKLLLEIEHQKQLYDDDEINVIKGNEISYLSSNDLDSSEIYWALYIVSEKVGNYDNAWKYLSLAHEKELSRRAFNFDKFNLISQTENIKSVFTEQLLNSMTGYTGSDLPVFIVGMMRSGSTLLETMLDAHDEIWGMGEDSVFNVNLVRFRDDLVNAIATGRKQEMYGVITKHSDYVIKRMTEQAESYSNSSNKEKISRVVDKMLFNFRNIGFIHLVYPNAVILHTMRDPMDTLFSCWKNKFDDYGLDWSLKIDSLVLQYSNYLEIMHHFRKVLPGRVIDVRYEELVSKPVKILKNIINKMEISWDENMLNFHLTNRSVHTNSQSQVRHGLYKKSIGSWRKYAKHLAPMIKLFKKELIRLRKMNALPYLDEMNWDLDPLYDYESIYGLDNSNSIDSARNSTSSTNSISYQSPTIISNNNINNVERLKNNTNNNIYYTSRISSSEIVIAKKGDIISINSNGSIFVTNYKTFLKTSYNICANDLSNSQSFVKLEVGEVNNVNVSLVEGNMTSNDIKLLIKSQNYKDNLIFLHDYYNSLWDDKNIRMYQTSLFKKVNAYDTKLEELISYSFILLNERNILDAIDVLHGSLDISYSMLFSNYSEFYGLMSKSFSFHQNRENHFRYIVDFSKSSNFNYLNQTIVSLLSIQWYGLSLIYALDKQMNNAILSLNTLLIFDSNNTDALNRLSEFRQSIGLLDEALIDISKAIKILSNTQYLSNSLADSFILRGIIKFQQRDFVESNNDFLKAANILSANSKHNFKLSTKLSEDLISILNISDSAFIIDNAKLWYFFGKSEKELSNWMVAAKYQLYAISINPKMIEAYLELGITLIEVSFWQDGLYYLKKTVQFDKSQLLAYGYIGLLYQSLGETQLAIDIFSKALNISNDLQCQYLLSMCLQASGNYMGTLTHLTNIITITQSNPNERDRFINSYTRREIASYQVLHRYDDILSYNIDKDINFKVKEIHAYPSRYTDDITTKSVSYYKYNENFLKSNQSNHLSKLITNSQLNINLICNYTDNVGEDQLCYQSKCITKEAIDHLINITSRIGQWMQLNSTGFLPNKRQHRMFGLSVLQLAQTFRLHTHYKHINFEGLYIPDKSSSSLNYFGFKRSMKLPVDDKSKYHVFGWRDAFDILVKWRGISDPNDIVWWIDKIILKDDDRKSLNERFIGDHRIGLNTYITSGVSKVHRYYSYFNKCFEFTKMKLLRDQAYDHKELHIKLDTLTKQKVKLSNSLEDLYKAVDSKPFYVIPFLQSSLKSNNYLNGTRITLQKAYPDGFDYSIRSASTPERFLQYELELNHNFNQYIDSLYSYMYESNSNIKSSDLLKLGLKIFYYWVNFGATTRGSSVIGYAVLYSCVLAIEEEFVDSIPFGVQLDWEAMLHETADSFIEVVLPMITRREPTSISKNYFSINNINQFDHICCKGDDSKYGDNYNDCKSCQTRVSQMFRNTATITYILSNSN